MANGKIVIIGGWPFFKKWPLVFYSSQVFEIWKVIDNSNSYKDSSDSDVDYPSGRRSRSKKSKKARKKEKKRKKKEKKRAEAR